MLRKMVLGLLFLLCVTLLIILLKIIKSPTCRSKMGNKVLVSVFGVTFFTLTALYLRMNKTNAANYFIRDTTVRYGIMFDAGSTGSRMHVFRFNVSDKDPLLILDDSLFVSTKPGLSSYANNPSEASKSLKPMLDKARNYIPEEFWYATPVALKATAGLRLLSEKAAASILEEIEELFRGYPFQLVKDGISILEGDDEGLFSWFTVNYLNGNLKNLSETSGVLDLGGGSTQITFVPHALSSFKEHFVNVTLLDKSYQMYTHSYLGLGMMSARFQILGGSEKLSGEVESQDLVSPCLPPSYSGVWSYRGQIHEIGSPNTSMERFKICKLKSKEIINKYNVKKPSSLKFFAISYFFDMALEGNIITNAEEGIDTNVETFHKLAENACKSTNTSKPFHCVDLCYISSLLIDGYGLDPKQTLTLKREIRDFEIAWPLGAMFNVYGIFNKVKSRHFN